MPGISRRTASTGSSAASTRPPTPVFGVVRSSSSCARPDAGLDGTADDRRGGEACRPHGECLAALAAARRDHPLGDGDGPSGRPATGRAQERDNNESLPWWLGRGAEGALQATDRVGGG